MVVASSGSVTTFVGVDLAWQSERNSTGIAVARGEAAVAELTDVASGIAGLDAVLTFIDSHATDHTVVAIDAPLIIRNESGRRPCESEVSRRFGARHAGAHSSNLALYPSPATHALVRRLESAGFRHVVSQERRSPGRWFFEVHPHPASVVLFDLDSIVKYKAKTRRRRSFRLVEFRRFESLLKSLHNAEPSLSPEPGVAVLSADIASLQGQALKNREDALDAWFCAYLALHAWYWGAERNEIVGDFENGYIVLPTVPVQMKGVTR